MTKFMIGLVAISIFLSARILNEHKGCPCGVAVESGGFEPRRVDDEIVLRDSRGGLRARLFVDEEDVVRLEFRNPKGEKKMELLSGSFSGSELTALVIYRRQEGEDVEDCVLSRQFGQGNLILGNPLRDKSLFHLVVDQDGRSSRLKMTADEEGISITSGSNGSSVICGPLGYLMPTTSMVLPSAAMRNSRRSPKSSIGSFEVWKDGEFVWSTNRLLKTPKKK